MATSETTAASTRPRQLSLSHATSVSRVVPLRAMMYVDAQNATMVSSTK